MFLVLQEKMVKFLVILYAVRMSRYLINGAKTIFVLVDKLVGWIMAFVLGVCPIVHFTNFTAIYFTFTEVHYTELDLLFFNCISCNVYLNSGHLYLISFHSSV